MSGKLNAPQRSQMHAHVLKLIRQAWPSLTIKEEQEIQVQINGRSHYLRVDIVIVDLKVCIECQGRQHSEYVAHMHGSREAFEASRVRDQAKSQAVRDAGYTLVEIQHDEHNKLTPLSLMQRITGAMKEAASG